MGFFDRLAKSFRIKNETEVATPDESRTYTNSSPPPQPVIATVVPAQPNGLDQLAESRASIGPAPVAVAELPAIDESCNAQARFAAESRVAIFQVEFDTAVAVAEMPAIDESCDTQAPFAVESGVVIFQPDFNTSVAVTEMPTPGEPANAQVAFTAEPSGAAIFGEDFDQDLDDAFASLVNKETSADAQGPSQEMFAADQSSVEDLFADIAANHARPVKNFIFELKRGTATKDWIELCIPAMSSISRAAEGMGLTVAVQRMVDFEAALSLGLSSKQRTLGGEVRDLLLRRYEDLTEIMPKAFVVAEEERQREGIIINSLLRQIPGVGRATVGKLYRAGLTSMDTLQMARTDELAVATGIPARLSELICAKFQSYRARLENNHHDPSDLGQRGRLTKMVDELRSHHKNFQRTSKNVWSNPALAIERKEHRQQRQSCILWINVLLAEEGEVELVEQLKKLSFDRRIRRLEEYLADATVVQ